jgi:glycosyltransferase involved in cell wall biosynthesis
VSETLELLAPETPVPVAGCHRLRRVLYAIYLYPSRQFGSLEEQILFVARAFQEESSLFLPLFISPMVGENAARFKAAGVEVEWLDLRHFQWRTLWHLVRLLRKYRIEVIHWNFFGPLNKYVWFLNLLTPRVQHYFTDHNSRLLPIKHSSNPLTRAVKRLLLKSYSKVFCVSDFVRQCLHEQQTWSTVSSCLHFINTERFKPDADARSAVRKQLGVGDQFVLLAVSQLIKEKGVDLAIRALREVPERVVLWIVGEGPESARLQALCQELSLQDRVRFFGLQKHVEPYMQAADCLVCPSLWAEAAGLANMEAQACGLPVIASKVGGIPEFLDEGRTGWLFPAGDHRQLAARVRRLLSAPQFCRQMGQEARALAVKRFAAEERIGEYLDLYRTTVARGSETSAGQEITPWRLSWPKN